MVHLLPADDTIISWTDLEIGTDIALSFQVSAPATLLLLPLLLMQCLGAAAAAAADAMSMCRRCCCCCCSTLKEAWLPTPAGGARLQLHLGAGAARAGEQQPTA